MWSLSLLKLLLNCTRTKKTSADIRFYAGKIQPQVVLTQLKFAKARVSFLNGIHVCYGYLLLQNPVTTQLINNIHTLIGENQCLSTDY